MGKNKLKIGEFSRLGRVTVRALRHYEEIDLLTPEIVDRDTGYRYYSVGQLQKIFSITKLKSMGYSLEEIRDLWDDDQHFPTVESLVEKIRKCEDELAVLKERKRMLKAVVASQKKLHKMEKVYFEALPAITVASHRTIIPSFQDLGRLCCEVIGPEMARLGVWAANARNPATATPSSTAATSRRTSTSSTARWSQRNALTPRSSSLRIFRLCRKLPV